MGVDPEGCIGPLTATPDVTTFIPISHGCDKMCSFCIIPYRRGRDMSRRWRRSCGSRSYWQSAASKR